MIRRRAATATHYVRQSALDEFAKHFCHHFGRVIILPKLVWQTGVGIDGDKSLGHGGEGIEKGPYLLGSQCAVEADRQQIDMADGVPERFHSLPGKCPAAGVGDSAGDHEGNFFSPLLQHCLNGKKCRFAVERIKDCLNKQDINTAIQ